MEPQALCSPPKLRKILGCFFGPVQSPSSQQTAFRFALRSAHELACSHAINQLSNGQSRGVRGPHFFRCSLPCVTYPSLLVSSAIFWDFFSFGIYHCHICSTNSTKSHGSLLCSSGASGPYIEHHCQELVSSHLLIALNNCWKEPNKSQVHLGFPSN